MVGLSVGEKNFLKGGIAQDLRTDGRKRLAYRLIYVEIGVIPQASGSARVKMGATDVIASVKAELGKPNPSHPNKGRVFIYVDCSSTAEPTFEGRGGDELSAELSTALQRCLLGGRSGAGAAIDLSSLSVVQGKVCWDLYIDGLVVSADGNILDALGAAIKDAKRLRLAGRGRGELRRRQGVSGDAMDADLPSNPASRYRRRPTAAAVPPPSPSPPDHRRRPTTVAARPPSPPDHRRRPTTVAAALSNTCIPRVQVCADPSSNEQPEVDVSDEEFVQFDTSGVPVIVTLTKVGRHCIVDATSEEESQMSSAVSISVNREGHVCGLTKRGGAGLDPADILDMVNKAQVVGSELINDLDSKIAAAEACEEEES
nr:exosome complex component RRP42 [Ipomoea trifida]